MNTLENHCARLLLKQKKTVSIAESCSGGLLSSRLTDIPGSSKYFKAAIIAYSNEIKTKQLMVPSKIINRNGAVSKEVALLMAKNIRRIAKTNIGLGITGIAGPSGATKTKPVGLVYIALATKNYQIIKKFNFKGGRLAVKRQASSSALKLLYNFLTKWSPTGKPRVPLLPSFARRSITRRRATAGYPQTSFGRNPPKQSHLSLFSHSSRGKRSLFLRRRIK